MINFSKWEVASELKTLFGFLKLYLMIKYVLLMSWGKSKIHSQFCIWLVDTLSLGGIKSLGLGAYTFLAVC